MAGWTITLVLTLLGAEGTGIGTGGASGTQIGTGEASGTPVGTAARGAAETKLRGYHEYNKAIDELLRAEVRAPNPRERAETIRAMTTLYRDLLRDPRLDTSDTLKGYKAKLWTRLTRIKSDLERQLRREGKDKRPAPTPAELAEAEALQQATQGLADQMSLMNYTMGGPGYLLAQTGGAFGGGTAQDNADQLIQLIQHTIRPDFWDTVGGPGSMFYYRPLMALVVRATAEVHGNVGGLLEAMRRAGQ